MKRLNNATLTGRKAMIASNKTKEKREEETKMALYGFCSEYSVEYYDNVISELAEWDKEDAYEELAVDGSSENMIEYLCYISRADDSDYYFYQLPNGTSAVVEIYFDCNNLVEYATLNTVNQWFAWM